MPIRNEDPHDYPNHEEEEDENENAVYHGENIAASGADSADNEPVNVEEDGDDDEEGESSVDKVFGIMLEKKEE